MTYEALVLDEVAVEVLDAALIEAGWFESFPLPKEADRLKRVQLDRTVYIISSSLDTCPNLVVVDLAATSILRDKEQSRYAFDRILRVALHLFRREVAIPLKWQPYHDGSLLSVYAETAARGSGERLFFDQQPSEDQDCHHLFAFGSGASGDLNLIPRNTPVYKNAISRIEEAILTEPQPPIEAGNFSLILSQPLGASISGGASLDEWYENKVTAQQRQFIDSPLDEPVRLRGAAGTGKTQSIAIKVLREMKRAEDECRPFRAAVITHSSALAHDVILGMLFAMDQAEQWKTYKYASLWIGTLYELAQDLLQYDRKGLVPLSLDGREGRQLQQMILADILGRKVKGAQFNVSTRKSLSAAFAELISNDQEGAVNEILNEFAASIDADNIVSGTQEADRYVSAKREPWQYPFSEADRKFLLDLHIDYVSDLESQNLLSMDQVVADLNHYLHLHEWRQLRKARGYDAIFVDEYHFFNRSEASSLHNLFREAKSASGKLAVFMAYDLKQGRDDVALKHGSKAMMNFTATQAGASNLVELTEVFRSTPQIAEFLRDLDGAFPALDLEGEWLPYGGFSKGDDGHRPTVETVDTNQKLVDHVFQMARERIAATKEGGRQVAVLCLNERLFDQYLNAGRLKDLFVPVTDRGDLTEFRYARRKCVFSMPQYVAGLQFSSVFLIHVDDVDFDPARNTNGQVRRQIANCYVGASRASKSLNIVCSKERGGIASILAGAIANASLVSAN